MASVNKVILVGNLGADPETRYMPSGDAVCNVRLATTEKWKDKATGEANEHTEWHRVSFFGRLADVAGQYLKKGSPVYVEGRIRTRKWQDRDTGQDRYATEIIGDSMQLLGSGRRYDDEDSASRGAPPSREAPPSRAPASRAPVKKAPAGGGFADMDDDIPF